jgi:hypothetical protein
MWHCTGLRWRDVGPVWTWWLPGAAARSAARSSPLRLGGTLSFAVGAEAVRSCLGVWRGGRFVPCPYAAELSPQARRDQCERCAALDRTYSVAADTKVDDPRPYAVYLAYFGPGRHKVGITAVERGAARLREQAAICFTFVGEGPLMTARRTESILGSALGLPDRVSSTAKRAARLALPDVAARAAELRALHGRVADLLPDTLRPRPFDVVDHAALFGLTPTAPRPTAEITALPRGAALTATISAVAGADLYLTPVEAPGGTLLLDSRLAAGWPLRRPATPTSSGFPTTTVAPPVEAPQSLF